MGNKQIQLKLVWMSSKTFILIVFVLAHAVLLIMMLYTFPIINDKLGTQAFDLKTFGYSESEALSMLQNLDQDTIDIYLFPQLFFLDILYPALLALFLSSLIIRLSRLTNINSNHLFSRLSIIPFIAMICDYMENILISWMITNILEVSTGIVKTASIFTQMKGGFTMLSWAIIIFLLGMWLKKKW